MSIVLAKIVEIKRVCECLALSILKSYKHQSNHHPSTMSVHIQWPAKAESVKILGYVHEGARRDAYRLARDILLMTIIQLMEKTYHETLAAPSS